MEAVYTSIKAAQYNNIYHYRDTFVWYRLEIQYTMERCILSQYEYCNASALQRI